MKKVEDLCSQDFIDSAESSADVRISHSTVTYIDPNLETGSGTISFAVGKHKIKVRGHTLETSILLGLPYMTSTPKGEREVKRISLICGQTTRTF